MTPAEGKEVIAEVMAGIESETCEPDE